MKSMTCIICPVGCQIDVDQEMNVIGNRCPRGKAYAITELTNPTRTLTSTVKTAFKDLPRLPVKTSAPIPKNLIFEIMKDMDDILVQKHVKIGDVIVKDIHHTGADLIATRSIPNQYL